MKIPIHVASKQRLTLKNTFPNAFQGSPSLSSCNVSSEKVEKVVYAPKKPTNKAARHSTLA
jgi:hypothetical protein